jgi:hypothetical protein
VDYFKSLLVWIASF